MKLIQIGVTSVRGPDGSFYPSEPIYREVNETENKKLIDSERKMIDNGASIIAKAMKKYIETFTKG